MSDTPYARWYNDGTVAFTQGSTTVTGTNTYWVSAGVKAGDIFVDANGKVYEITAVNDSTSITLGTPYSGDTGSGKTYSIIRTFNATMSASIAQQLSYFLKEQEARYNLKMQTITGKSAYESAKENGYTGTVTEWLDSLTAYGVAVKNGYQGTAAEWIESLSAYGVAVKNGYTGTVTEWLESLKAANEWSTLDTRTDPLKNYSYIASKKNSIFRGKNLGSQITAEQYASICAGKYDDMFIGDYWNINGHIYQIAHFELRRREFGKGYSSHQIILWFRNPGFTCPWSTTLTTCSGGLVSSDLWTTTLPDMTENTILVDIPEEYISPLSPNGFFAVSSAVNSSGSISGWYVIPGLQITIPCAFHVCGNTYPHDKGATAYYGNWAVTRHTTLALFRYISVFDLFTDANGFWLDSYCNQTHALQFNLWGLEGNAALNNLHAECQPLIAVGK